MLQDAKLRRLKAKSQKLISSMNAVVNENMHRNCQVDAHGFPTSNENVCQPRRLEILASLGKLMKTDECLSKPSFSPTSQFSLAWGYNTQLRRFLNNLSVTLTTQYNKFDQIEPLAI